MFILFPTQLFYNNKLLPNKKVCLVEEPRYFTDFKFHKLKLAYHRATMKKFCDDTKFNISYVEYHKVTETWFKNLSDEIEIIDPVDHILLKKYKSLTKKYKKTLIVHPTLNFLLSEEEIKTNQNKFQKKGKYYHDLFYKFQRVKLDILMKDDKPINNKWSFDKTNRDSLPKGYKLNKPPKNIKNEYVTEAKEYVNKHFDDNYGSLDNFIYPIDHKSSVKYLKHFLETKLDKFGKLQDAVSKNDCFMNHSILTPMMNIGLLTDTQVVTHAKKYYSKSNIESFEGFIRQVIGWRNYVYSLYVLDVVKNDNILGHTNKIDDKFWTSTGVLVIDDCINEIVKYAYVHHIKRLMYLGNFLLLLQVDPKCVYKYFMEWTIDSYDWVMVPNVYGMSQYSTDVMMTRPYFSSSNYIIKMSDYKKGEWSEKWNYLYYYFLFKHKSKFESNYAISPQIKHWNDKTSEEQKTIIKNAKVIINELTK
jgi:deoxyribodipyrimidine photolyase-related protein